MTKRRVVGLIIDSCKISKGHGLEVKNTVRYETMVELHFRRRTTTIPNRKGDSFILGYVVLTSVLICVSSPFLQFAGVMLKVPTVNYSVTSDTAINGLQFYLPLSNQTSTSVERHSTVSTETTQVTISTTSRW